MKVEEPKSITFIVELERLAFKNPQIVEHKNKNRELAIEEVSESVTDIESVKVIGRHDNIVLVMVEEPGTIDDAKANWRAVFNALVKNKHLWSISIQSANDLSDYIAANFADKVSRPYHKGYQGKDEVSLIYHK